MNVVEETSLTTDTSLILKEWPRTNEREGTCVCLEVFSNAAMELLQA
jgi:hypothetical protein